MNTPESREGNLIRYAIYLIGYLMAVGVSKLVTLNSPIRIWDIILFALVAVMVLLLYIYRFNREQRYFKRYPTMSWLSDYGLTVGLTLIITVSRICFSWLQAYNKVGLYGFQATFLQNEAVSSFWFMMAAVGIVIPALQAFLTTGFLFNYCFRTNNKRMATLGIVCSGILFSLLNFQMSGVILLINVFYGMLFAWVYLYTQTIWLPIYLAVINSVTVSYTH